jgi:Uma2 family endonuclease
MNWQDVLTDKSFTNLSYNIELNKQGHVAMALASNCHAYWQYEIAGILREQMRGLGMGFTEASIDTPEGVKVADVAWASKAFTERHGMATPFPRAPEICVEIISPSNSAEEIKNKTALYLEQGAVEVWLCSLDGKMQFLGAEDELENSGLVQGFPKRLDMEALDL